MFRTALLCLSLTFAAAALLAAPAVRADDLPDLGGRTIVAVTENAYTCLLYTSDAADE